MVEVEISKWLLSFYAPELRMNPYCFFSFHPELFRPCEILQILHHELHCAALIATITHFFQI